MSDESAAPFTATLKAGADYAAPWLVIRADTASELEDNLDQASAILLQKVNDIAELFIGSRTVVSTPASAPAASGATLPQSGNGGDLKTCSHGIRTKRQGTSSRGAWTGYFCPLQKGDPNQCKAIFE